MPTKRRTRLTKEIKEQFSDMACELSPENLCGDGEYTQAQAKDRFEKIMIRWHKLEDQIGMKVNDEIINQWEEENGNKES